MDDKEIVDRLVRVWIEPGKVPAFHYTLQRVIKNNWPSLYTVIRLAVQVRRERP